MNMVYFTASYPYGLGEEWKKNELLTFIKFFDNIVVVPFSYADNKNAIEYINGIDYSTPIFENNYQIKLKYIDIFKIIFTTSFHIFWSEFFSNRVYLSKVKLIQWATACLKMDSIKKNSVFKKYLDTADENTIFYFFWGRETSEVLPILNKRVFNVVKVHGYDLYSEIYSSNYIPFQKIQLESCDMILTISDYGKKYLSLKYPHLSKKIVTAKLGVNNSFLGKTSEDQILRIVSCSFLIKLKRINLLIDALKLCNGFRVEWTHIGDGPEMTSLMESSRELPSNVISNFIGKVLPKDVIKIYIDNPFDLFINVSETEGIPVSIMEAISVGLPIYATKVGGVSEIVCSSNGKLLQPDISPHELADEITQFYNLPRDQKLKLRQNSIQKYNFRYKADINNTELVHKIKKFKQCVV